MKPFAPSLCLILALSACVTAPEPEPVQVYDPNVDVTPGLNEKEPDTCKAQQYGYLVGQPVTALHTAGIRQSYRVIAPGAIVTQEYDSSRIDVSVDGAGLINKLSCG